ncbi:MAG: acyl-CoA dehydrogenase family protein [Actinomycetota bacterium]|nr:acyl-CoA/acyl-ACP dehydrogenase [Actinomycetota bacterium]
MKFILSEEQMLFRHTVREFLEKECTPEIARSGFNRERWAQLAQLGAVGLAAPADEGGLGLGEVDLVLLLEEAGRAALPDPLIETSMVAIPLLREAEANDLLLEAADGDVVMSVGLAGSRYVTYATDADVLLLQLGGAMFALQRDDVKLQLMPSIDMARPVFRVEWLSEAGTKIGEGADLVEAAFDRAVLGAAAQLLGIAQRCVEMAADYAKERHQFGKPIGSFQAIKHKLADALLMVEFARPVVYRAAASIAEVSHHRERDVSMAKVYAGRAAKRATRAALQTLGAIGYTQEHDLHIWMKRSWSLEAAWGTSDFHRDRIADEVMG